MDAGGCDRRQRYAQPQSIHPFTHLLDRTAQEPTNNIVIRSPIRVMARHRGISYTKPQTTTAPVSGLSLTRSPQKSRRILDQNHDISRTPTHTAAFEDTDQRLHPVRFRWRRSHMTAGSSPHNPAIQLVPEVKWNSSTPVGGQCLGKSLPSPNWADLTRTIGLFVGHLTNGSISFKKPGFWY